MRTAEILVELDSCIILRNKCPVCGERIKIPQDIPYKAKKSKLYTAPKYCSGECKKKAMVGHSFGRAKGDGKPIGTKKINRNGYVLVKTDDNRYHAEHRVVMEDILGRSLQQFEVVHHIDGDKSNNSKENLELWVSNHLGGIRASDLLCPHCGKKYFPIPETEKMP
jgi:hypothetical protein